MPGAPLSASTSSPESSRSQGDRRHRPRNALDHAFSTKLKPVSASCAVVNSDAAHLHVPGRENLLALQLAGIGSCQYQAFRKSPRPGLKTGSRRPPARRAAPRTGGPQALAASGRHTSSSWRRKACPSAVPCTSTNRRHCSSRRSCRSPPWSPPRNRGRPTGTPRTCRPYTAATCPCTVTGERAPRHQCADGIAKRHVCPGEEAVRVRRRPADVASSVTVRSPNARRSTPRATSDR